MLQELQEIAKKEMIRAVLARREDTKEGHRAIHVVHM